MQNHFVHHCIVFKFGGASVKDASGVKNLRRILQQFPKQNVFVVISAVGKTTNLLEKVLDAYFNGENWRELFEQLKNNHLTIAKELMEDASEIESVLNPIFRALEEKLQSTHSDCFEYEYDQIVSFGEILSTTLISRYLNLSGVKNQWLDVRRMLITDKSFMEAKLDWEKSAEMLDAELVSHSSDQTQVFVTQGFIAGSTNNLTTTFGREGSDYSAAIIAYLLDAESVTIWKDVPGLLNADPKFFPEAVKLDAISYEEAIELSYYGATIIHPKTLKPLQNKNIPLYIKPFLEPEAPGSVISATGQADNVPSYIFKRNQILITIFPKDFSFISVDNLSEIFYILSQHNVKINLMQNTALSFSICTDHKPRRIGEVLNQLTRNFLIKYNDNMELVTIRHYTDEIVAKVIAGRNVYAEQRSRTTVQVVVKCD